jgi:PAS domain S-box-containing protein
MRRGGRVGAFIGFLFAAGLGTGIAAEAVAGPVRVPWGQVPLLLGMVALASHLLVRFQVRDQVEALELTEAALVPTIAVIPGVAAVGLVVAAKGIVGALHRNDPLKAAFNAAQWGTATGCGTLVYAVLRDGSGLTGRNLVALAVAMVAASVVNYSAFTVVLALAGPRPLREVIAGLKPLMLVGWLGGSAVNLAFGLLFVAADVRTPAAVVVMAVPLVVLHWGGRGFATARTDTVRLTGLQTATHVLAGPIDPRDALPLFLAEVLRCFEADAVDLLETTPTGAVVHSVAVDRPYAVAPDDGTSIATRLLPIASEGAVVVDARRSGLLADGGWRIVAAAPVRTGDRTFGVLCVYNRGGVEGFEGGEIVVLEALAAEVAGALDKAELLEGMLEERRQLADIVGNTSDGIFTLDLSGAVTSWNAGLEQITGYPAESVLGCVPDLVLRARDGDGAPVELSRWAAAPDPLPDAVEIVAADRQTRWLSCTYTAVPSRDGRGPQLVVMARDITRAHELEKLKDDFVAVVSHELRTPLAPIKGWAVTLLKRGDELSDDQRREGSRAILRQADRLEQLILNILEDSRVEKDSNPTPVVDTVDAGVSVRKVVEDFATLAPDRPINVHGADGEIPVVGRSVRIDQILVNLVSNAVKYSPKDEPIDITVETGPDAVLISVTDNGPGIPPEARERIFERFERLADSPTQTGTGLGLYIARRLAASMGAELTIAPAIGGGSTFTLRLRSARQLAEVVLP